MLPKEIARLADGIFRRTLPANWAYRDQQNQEDYGIDAEVELMAPGDKATGFIFKLQIKGTTELVVHADGLTVAFAGLKVERLEYYVDSVKIPVVLVIVDVSNDVVYWTVLQGNTTISDALDDARTGQQQTLTVHIPSHNVLPTARDRLLEDVALALDWINVRAVQSLDSNRMTLAANRLDKTKLAASLSMHNEMVRMEVVEQLLEQGRYETAMSMSVDILNSPSESQVMRIVAAMNVERIDVQRTAISDSHRKWEEHLRTRFALRRSMLAIVRPLGTPMDLRVLTLGLARLDRLRGEVDRDYGLFLSERVQQTTGDEFTRAFTRAARAANARVVIGQIKRFDRFMTHHCEMTCVVMFPTLIGQLLTDITLFLMRLDRDAQALAATELRAWCSRLGALGCDVAATFGDWARYADCVIQGAVTYMADKSPEGVQRLAVLRQRLLQILDDALRADAFDSFDNMLQRMNTEPPRSLPIPHEKQIYADMARANGIDLDDPNDAISSSVRSGLDDLDPTRVLARCRHLLVSLGGSTGFAAKLIGLSTAGSKFVSCTKVGQSIGGMSLDGIDSLFQKKYCSTCSDCVPHPQGWVWTREYQQETEATHNAIVERCRGLM